MSLFSRKNEIADLQQQNMSLSSVIAKKDREIEQLRNQVILLQREQASAKAMSDQLELCKSELASKSQVAVQYYDLWDTSETRAKNLEEQVRSAQQTVKSLQNQVETKDKRIETLVKQLEGLLSSAQQAEETGVIMLPGCGMDEVLQFERECATHLDSMPIKIAQEICAYFQTYAKNRLHRETRLAAERNQWNAEMQKLCALLYKQLGKVSLTEKRLLLLELCGGDVAEIRKKLKEVSIHEITESTNEDPSADIYSLAKKRSSNLGTQGYAYPSTGDYADFDYRPCIVDGVRGVRIVGYTGRSFSRVIVPDTIRGLPVFKIAANTFRGSEIREVIIPPTVVELGEMAFANCTKLSSVIMPPSIKKIGEKCFADCYSLQAIVLPDQLTKLGQSAFENSSIASISFPALLSQIPGFCCNNCFNLKTIFIEDGVESIEACAFSECALAEVVIPGSVLRVHERAFENKYKMRIAFCGSHTEIVTASRSTPRLFGGRQSIFYANPGSIARRYAEKYSYRAYNLDYFESDPNKHLGGFGR